MGPIRPTALVIFSVGLLAVPSATAAPAQDTKGVAIKIQIGGHLLTQETGIASKEIPNSTEDSGGLLADFTVLGKDGGRTPFGVCLELEGNRVEAGPAVEGVGVQTFGIATIRIMGQMEVRLRGPQREPRASLQPYVSLGAGWNFHSVGAKIEWLALPPPTGTPLSLDLDGSPALRVGVGFHSKGTQGGLSVNLEGGWKWDAGDYSMRVQDQPDRQGSYDLSGVYLLFGITLRP
jgi:hypothetical protein